MLSFQLGSSHDGVLMWDGQMYVIRGGYPTTTTTIRPQELAEDGSIVTCAWVDATHWVIAPQDQGVVIYNTVSEQWWQDHTIVGHRVFPPNTTIDYRECGGCLIAGMDTYSWLTTTSDATTITATALKLDDPWSVGSQCVIDAGMTVALFDMGGVCVFDICCSGRRLFQQRIDGCVWSAFGYDCNTVLYIKNNHELHVLDARCCNGSGSRLTQTPEHVYIVHAFTNTVALAHGQDVFGVDLRTGCETSERLAWLPNAEPWVGSIMYDKQHTKFYTITKSGVETGDV